MGQQNSQYHFLNDQKSLVLQTAAILFLLTYQFHPIQNGSCQKVLMLNVSKTINLKKIPQETKKNYFCLTKQFFMFSVGLRIKLLSKIFLGSCLRHTRLAFKQNILEYETFNKNNKIHSQYVRHNNATINALLSVDQMFQLKCFCLHNNQLIQKIKMQIYNPLLIFCCVQFSNPQIHTSLLSFCYD